MITEQIEGIDFALAVYRDEGVWQVQEIAHDLLDDVETLAGALRRFPGDFGALALVAVDEDFFVIARVSGPQVRLLLSDVTAADEWEIAAVHRRAPRTAARPSSTTTRSRPATSTSSATSA